MNGDFAPKRGVDFTSSDLTGMQLDGQTYAEPDKQITGILHTQERSTRLYHHRCVRLRGGEETAPIAMIDRFLRAPAPLQPVPPAEYRTLCTDPGHKSIPVWIGVRTTAWI